MKDIHKVLDSGSNTIFLNTFYVGSGSESRKYGVFRKAFESLTHVSIYPTITSLGRLTRPPRGFCIDDARELV